MFTEYTIENIENIHYRTSAAHDTLPPPEDTLARSAGESFEPLTPAEILTSRYPSIHTIQRNTIGRFFFFENMCLGPTRS